VSVKRGSQTLCFLCPRSDTVLDLKRRACAALSQHRAASAGAGKEGDDASDDEGPLAPESMQLLLPEGSPAPAKKGSGDDDGEDDDDDGDEEMSDGLTPSRPCFLKDGRALGDLCLPGKAEDGRGEGGGQLVLHAVLAVADGEWEAARVVPTLPVAPPVDRGA
jgi:hypothetical protein